MERIKIGFVEKMDERRMSQCAILSKVNNFKIVFESFGSIDVWGKIATLEIDILVLADNISGFNFLNMFEIINSEKTLSQLKLILLTNEPNPMKIAEYIEAGAKGIVKNNMNTEELPHCIKAVYEKGMCFNYFLTRA